ncbi:MAG: xanthan lyase [Muribaculaceae bacterium]|nr:xanthan lyase [Muribaculaceae bacterium]
MNLKRVLALSISVILVGGCLSVSELEAAKKRSRSKARTSRTSSRRKTTSGYKKKTTRKTTARKAAATPAPPVDPPLNDSLTLLVNGFVLENIPADQNPGGLRVNSVKPQHSLRNVRVGLNENFTYLPVNRVMIDELRRNIKHILPDSLSSYDVSLHVGNRALAYYINKVDKLPEQYRTNIPFVRAVKPYINPVNGMEGDIVALWSSHGRYYKNGSWVWQRPLLFQSVEDTYTMGYVLPYLVPMLENAGAYVMMPRERDLNNVEVIVDNDLNDDGMLFSQTTYREMNGSRSWVTGEGEGFIYDLPDFRDTENPFENGTYRQTQTVRGGKPAVAAWYADIPRDGEYAVYVSYKSLPNSTTDAHYTVNYSGGSREFKVNQKMGGGTWIYLGTFPLEEGFSESVPVVTLTNISEAGGETVVTADAVKIGGGMGNIARSPRRSDIYYDPSTPLASAENMDEDTEDEPDDEDIDGEDEVEESQPATSNETRVAPTFRTSGLPRYLEGARYWMHWAGAPESVYSPYHGGDDYKDDYTGRGHWVNWLAGGSRVLPNRQGLNIPVDISFALHSDAGKRADDSFVGTLGIYYTNDGASYADGTPRINSRMLTDLVMRQICGDIRRSWEPSWTRRSMWDKSYLEARVAEVPTTLIELMSHQNFADMQYGLDPAFKFTVARAIYKGMARFMAERKNRKLVIQPLPVKDFAITRSKKGHYRLSWQPTPDPAEPTAMPTKYIILERTEGTSGFHKVGDTGSTHFDIKVDDDLIRSYRVIAANEGGLSFPSETLALREAEDNSKPVLIINGFTRVSGPEHFSFDGRAGFDSNADFGVPYIREISYTGQQTEYSRNAGESFGRSASNYVDKIIAGNTFDYPAVHGESIAEAGYGFVSCSLGAIEAGTVRLNEYKTVDLILGRQKTTVTGRGQREASAARFEAFPVALRVALEAYVRNGGTLIVSGEKAVSDLSDYRYGVEGTRFASDVLGVRLAETDVYSNGRVSGVYNAGGTGFPAGEIRYSNTLNSERYMVQRPDMLEPAGNGSITLMTFDNGTAAGVMSRTGNGRVYTLSIPIESITDDTQRDLLMKSLLKEK